MFIWSRRRQSDRHCIRESEIIDGGKVQISARAEEGDKGLKSNHVFRSITQSSKMSWQIRSKNVAYKTLVERKEKADSDSISWEQGRNSFNSTKSKNLQSDGWSIVDTSYLRDEALDNIPDGVKNDLDAHIRNRESFVY